MFGQVSDEDRECTLLQYFACFGLTPTQAHCRYEFSNIQQSSKEVEVTLTDVQCIHVHQAISDLAVLKNHMVHSG